MARGTKNLDRLSVGRFGMSFVWWRNGVAVLGLVAPWIAESGLEEFGGREIGGVVLVASWTKCAAGSLRRNHRSPNSSSISAEFWSEC